MVAGHGGRERACRGQTPPELPCCRAGLAGEQSSCGGADHLSPGVPSVRGPKSAGAFQQPHYVPHGVSNSLAKPRTLPPPRGRYVGADSPGAEVSCASQGDERHAWPLPLMPIAPPVQLGQSKLSADAGHRPLEKANGGAPPCPATTHNIPVPGWGLHRGCRAHSCGDAGSAPCIRKLPSKWDVCNHLCLYERGHLKRQKFRPHNIWTRTWCQPSQRESTLFTRTVPCPLPTAHLTLGGVCCDPHRNSCLAPWTPIRRAPMVKTRPDVAPCAQGERPQSGGLEPCSHTFEDSARVQAATWNSTRDLSSGYPQTTDSLRNMPRPRQCVGSGGRAEKTSRVSLLLSPGPAGKTELRNHHEADASS